MPFAPRNRASSRNGTVAKVLTASEISPLMREKNGSEAAMTIIRTLDVDIEQRLRALGVIPKLGTLPSLRFSRLSPRLMALASSAPRMILFLFREPRRGALPP
jgi:hypothetical protein